MNGRSKLWATALLAGVLVFGGAVGAAVDRLLSPAASACQTASTREQRDRGRDRNERRNYVEWLTTELQLTDAQRVQVDTIIERHRQRVSALWKEVRPQYEQMKQNLRQEIRGVLTGQQRARYEELVREHDSRRGRRDG
jgi:gas vesicle protein